MGIRAADNHVTGFPASEGAELEPAWRIPLLDRALLCGAVLATVAVVALRLPLVLRNYSGLDHVSGAWLTQAIDLANGLFYRPLFSAAGYGGTRYMPLYTVLNAATIRAGLAPIWAGYLVTFLSAGLLSAAVYLTMRRLGSGRLLSASVGVLWMATTPGQLAVSGVRSDLLAAGLSILGFALCLPSLRRREPSPVGAAVLFALAFAAKITTVFGFAGGLVALLVSGRRKHAAVLAAATVAGILVVVTATDLASHGRWLENMRACASAGMGPAALVRGPAGFVKHIVSDDPFGATLYILCGALALACGRRALEQPAFAALAATALVTVALYCTPGTNFNHLLDLDVIALVFLAGATARAATRAPRAVMAIALICAAGAVNSYLYYRDKDASPNRQEVMHILAESGERGKPIFAGSALVPLMNGERPYLMDVFMARVCGEKCADIRKDLFAKLESRGFRAIVEVSVDVGTEEGRRWRDQTFGEGFTETMLRNYRFASRHGRYYLFLPYDPAAEP